MVKRWEKEERCPFCGKRLPEDKEVEDHLNKILDTIREASPDVSDDELEAIVQDKFSPDACENLAPKVVLDPDND